MNRPEKIDYVSDDSEVIGQQLLLNYCFGHSDSPLLLCPQTNMILMNHCSSRKPGKGQCGTKGPNAKIQWGRSWDENTPKWLEMSLEEIAEMTENKRRGLSVEVIATRDIFPGQEVFIDYGEEWEEAWYQHLKEWEPPIDDGTYVPVKTMIENKDLRTVDELEDNPYPENVMNVCYYSSYFEQDAEGDEASEWEEDGSAYKVGPDGMDREKNVYWCEILEKPSDTKSGYTIKISITDLQTGYLTNYPEESISFRMNRYKSDVHLPGAFRHFISIDDEMFPQQWKVKEEVLEE